MATLVHPSSAESTTSELDLFSVPPSQTSLEDRSFTEYHPVSVLISTDPIKFIVLKLKLHQSCKQLSICSSKRDCSRRSGFSRRRGNRTRMLFFTYLMVANRCLFERFACDAVQQQLSLLSLH